MKTATLITGMSFKDVVRVLISSTKWSRAEADEIAAAVVASDSACVLRVGPTRINVLDGTGVQHVAIVSEDLYEDLLFPVLPDDPKDDPPTDPLDDMCTAADVGICAVEVTLGCQSAKHMPGRVFLDDKKTLYVVSNDVQYVCISRVST